MSRRRSRPTARTIARRRRRADTGRRKRGCGSARSSSAGSLAHTPTVPRQHTRHASAGMTIGRRGSLRLDLSDSSACRAAECHRRSRFVCGIRPATVDRHYSGRSATIASSRPAPRCGRPRRALAVNPAAAGFSLTSINECVDDTVFACASAAPEYRHTDLSHAVRRAVDARDPGVSNVWY